VREILTETCPTCGGEGVVPSAETMAIEVLRKLRDLVASQPEPEAFLIRVNPNVAAELVAEDSGLAELEAESGKHFHFEGGEALAIDTYDVIESGSRRQIEERALPFRVGEEVLVTIEEPHMYNADDAIARVDSYIVSVEGAGDHIGERRLVRIEDVARSAATASLLDANGEKVESGSSGRRRGRRGGRRRSRARAGNDG
jgi:ribonuclease G